MSKKVNIYRRAEVDLGACLPDLINRLTEILVKFESLGVNTRQTYLKVDATTYQDDYTSTIEASYVEGYSPETEEEKLLRQKIAKESRRLNRERAREEAKVREAYEKELYEKLRKKFEK